MRLKKILSSKYRNSVYWKQGIYFSNKHNHCPKKTHKKMSPTAFAAATDETSGRNGEMKRMCAVLKEMRRRFRTVNANCLQ